MIVVLLGYMGSGKSTIGKALATVLKYSFLDLDDYISDKEGASVTEIFSSKGEIYFRKKETQYLREIVNSKDDIVLALGGGTPCYANNMTLLNAKENVVSIYLKLTIPQLAERLFKEKAHRPLISHITSKDNLLEFIGKHLFERAQYYNEAKYSISVDNKSKQELIEAILMRLI